MPKGDYPSIGEYAEAQKKLGSCLPEFRATMIKSVQIGSTFGVPFGLYVAWRQHGTHLKPFLGKSFATWMTSTLTFTCLGLMGGVYNCLRVKFE
ncbi:hypothetical protein CAEBREN_12718 [Caenorhabditis brenneri]|uniref:Uncharacterized protein n=1 Tax=Caenorhabditis brenneri TaxID=135651 RepID=G0MQC4_CAEBE|nr:hypothetical protein CAEBREN_16542 [Caenorhabditis brenneri]EGT53348.1 hypothetical protein CAEBREN_12718 [Caenorhabditis brenneri]